MQPFYIERNSSLQDVVNHVMILYLGRSINAIDENEIATSLMPQKSHADYIASFNLHYGESVLGEILLTKYEGRIKVTFTPHPKQPATK